VVIRSRAGASAIATPFRQSPPHLDPAALKHPHRAEITGNYRGDVIRSRFIHRNLYANNKSRPASRRCVRQLGIISALSFTLKKIFIETITRARVSEGHPRPSPRYESEDLEQCMIRNVIRCMLDISRAKFLQTQVPVIAQQGCVFPEPSSVSLPSAGSSRLQKISRGRSIFDHHSRASRESRPAETGSSLRRGRKECGGGNEEVVPRIGTQT